MKKYFIGLAIVATAIGAFAFIPEKKKSEKAMDTHWYEYTLTSWYEYRGPQPASDNDLKDENNYFLVDAPSGCTSNQTICAVNVPGSGEHPDNFSGTIETDILSAAHNNSPESGYIEMKP